MAIQDFSTRTPTRLDGELATCSESPDNPLENETASSINITLTKKNQKQIMKKKRC